MAVTRKQFGSRLGLVAAAGISVGSAMVISHSVSMSSQAASEERSFLTNALRDHNKQADAAVGAYMSANQHLFPDPSSLHITFENGRVSFVSNPSLLAKEVVEKIQPLQNAVNGIDALLGPNGLNKSSSSSNVMADGVGLIMLSMAAAGFYPIRIYSKLHPSDFAKDPNQAERFKAYYSEPVHLPHLISLTPKGPIIPNKPA